MLPISAVATLMGAEADRGVQLSAAGPVPAPAPEVTGEVSGPPIPGTAVEGAVPPAGATTEDTSQPSGGLSAAPTGEEQRRGAAIDGSEMPPRSPASLPSADDPVVRSAPATPSGASSGEGPPTTVPTGNDSVAACPAAEVGVIVTTEKSTYAAGETVRGSSTLENRSSTTCLLPTRAFFRILDAAGGTVGSFAYTMELRMPVKAAPGKTFTSTFTWDQKNCSGSSCAQVPPGTYEVVADWNESGPYSGRASFQIA